MIAKTRATSSSGEKGTVRRIVVEDLFTDRDLVVLHWAAHSTHPSNKSVKPALVGVTTCRFAGRQIAESWTYWDAGNACQLALAPPLAEREREVRSDAHGFVA